MNSRVTGEDKQCPQGARNASDAQHATTSEIVELPMLTNSRAVRKGEELVLQVPEPPATKKRAETWKDDLGKGSKKQKMASDKDQRQSKKPTTSYDEI